MYIHITAQVSRFSFYFHFYLTNNDHCLNYLWYFIFLFPVDVMLTLSNYLNTTRLWEEYFPYDNYHISNRPQYLKYTGKVSSSNAIWRSFVYTRKHRVGKICLWQNHGWLVSKKMSTGGKPRWPVLVANCKKQCDNTFLNSLTLEIDADATWMKFRTQLHISYRWRTIVFVIIIGIVVLFVVVVNVALHWGQQSFAYVCYHH